MNINSLNDLKKQTELGTILLSKIKKYDEWINLIKNREAESVWIGSELVYFKENCASCGIQGICTKDEAKELSEIIKNYLVDKLEKKKIKIEESFKNL